MKTLHTSRTLNVIRKLPPSDIALVMQAMVQVGDKWRQNDNQNAPLQFVDASSGEQLRLALMGADATASASRPSIKIEAGPGADDLMRWRL